MFGIGFVNKKITPCSKADFQAAITSKAVYETCNLIARLEKRMAETTDEKRQKWCENRISQAKRTLPCITPMATFRNDVRKVEFAVPSGLNMLDIDHVDNPRQLWEDIKVKCPYQVGLVHITPSTHGLRIIFPQPEGKSIADAQAELARALSVAYDGVTKDLARCSFLVPEDYIISVNYKLLFSDERKDNVNSKPQNTETKTPSQENANEQVDAELGRREYPTSFKGVAYSEIIDEILAHTGYDTTPSVGERNTALYVLARNLRYCCDFDSDFIISLLPDWGLPPSEVRNTVDSAVKSIRTTLMPRVLSKIVEQKQKATVRDSELYKSPFECEIVEEGIIGEFVKTQPLYLKVAAYLTAMTCFGTLLTRLRGHGPDGNIIAPNFMLAVSAPQASGKSFMKRIANQVLKPVKDEDSRQRAKMKEIERENRRNKDKEDYEEKEFEGAIRILPSNTSNRILLERMDKAKGQHCIIMAEEIDSITKAEKSGKWSEKSDIYRLAFDNSEWGQDYASENSYHAVVPLYLNLLFSGTPAAVARFFADVENGLVTRFLFCDLPDTYGQKRPKIIKWDDDAFKFVEERCHHYWEVMQNVGTEDGLIWMNTEQMNEDVTNMYDEVQRFKYLYDQDNVARDLARRRYATLAVEMMMVETYLNDGVYTESIRDRVISVINYCSEQLIANYGEALNKSLNESVEKQQEAVRVSRKQLTLDALPDTFTTKEFINAAAVYNGNKNCAEVMLSRLVKGGVVEVVERGIYRKVK